MPHNCFTMVVIPGSSTVEHSAVNRRVASSNLARGAKFSFSLSHLQNLLSQLLSLDCASVIQVS